jgi:hypothetical protein
MVAPLSALMLVFSKGASVSIGAAVGRQLPPVTHSRRTFFVFEPKVECDETHTDGHRRLYSCASFSADSTTDRDAFRQGSAGAARVRLWVTRPSDRP